MMDLQAVISSLLFGSESLNFGLKVPKAGQATYIRGYLVLEFENTGSSGHDAELASILIRVDRPSNFDLLPRLEALSIPSPCRIEYTSYVGSYRT